MYNRRIGLGVVAALAASLGSVMANDWPQFRGLNHNGISTEKGWYAEGAAVTTVWKTQVGAGYSAVAVVGAKVYTMGNAGGQDTVYCLNAASNGAVFWKHSYACPGGSYEGPRSTPAVDGDSVYTLSREGDVLCLSAASGEVRWSRQLKAELRMTLPGWGFAGSPLVEQNMVILNVGGHGMALEKTSGKTLWESGTTAAGYASPVPFQVGGRSCLALFGAKELVGLNARDGKELWRFPWETKYDVNASDPVPVAGDRIFISSGYDRGCAMLKVTPDQVNKVWENKAMASHFSGIIVWQGCLYGVNGNVGGGGLKCLDIETGAEKWSKPYGFGSFTMADGKIVYLRENGELILVELVAEGVKELLRSKVMGGQCWTSPVVANGNVYCRNHEGELLCLDVSRK